MARRVVARLQDGAYCGTAAARRPECVLLTWPAQPHFNLAVFSPTAAILVFDRSKVFRTLSVLTPSTLRFIVHLLLSNLLFELN